MFFFNNILIFVQVADACKPKNKKKKKKNTLINKLILLSGKEVGKSELDAIILPNFNTKILIKKFIKKV